MNNVSRLYPVNLTGNLADSTVVHRKPRKKRRPGLGITTEPNLANPINNLYQTKSTNKFYWTEFINLDPLSLIHQTIFTEPNHSTNPILRKLI